MRSTPRNILGIALGLVGLLSPLVCVAEQMPSSPPLPTARLVRVEGASYTYHLIDRGGRRITATVPSQSITDVKTSSQDGTVRAVVASINQKNNQTKVVTDAGQTLVLAMDPQTLAGVRVGDSYTFMVSPHGEFSAAASPRNEMAAQR